VTRSRSILISDLETLNATVNQLSSDNRNLQAQLEILQFERKQRQQYEEAVANVREKLEELIQDNEELVAARIELQRFIMELRQEASSNSSSAWKSIRKRLLAFQPPQQSARLGARGIFQKIQLFESIASQTQEEAARIENFRRSRSVSNLNRLSAKVSKPHDATSALTSSIATSTPATTTTTTTSTSTNTNTNTTAISVSLPTPSTCSTPSSSVKFAALRTTNK
jgi:chromosome segregation ATPase